MNDERLDKLRQVAFVFMIMLVIIVDVAALIYWSDITKAMVIGMAWGAGTSCYFRFKALGRPREGLLAVVLMIVFQFALVVALDLGR